MITRVAEAALNAEDCPYEAEVDVLLTDNASIRTINRDSRGIDRATIEKLNGIWKTFRSTVTISTPSALETA